MAITYVCDRSRKKVPLDEVIKLRILKSPGSAELRARHGYELHLSAEEGIQFLAWLARREAVAPLPAEPLTRPPVERNHRPVPYRT